MTETQLTSRDNDKARQVRRRRSLLVPSLRGVRNWAQWRSTTIQHARQLAWHSWNCSAQHRTSRDLRVSLLSKRTLQAATDDSSGGRPRRAGGARAKWSVAILPPRLWPAMPSRPRSRRSNSGLSGFWLSLRSFSARPSKNPSWRTQTEVRCFTLPCSPATLASAAKSQVLVGEILPLCYPLLSSAAEGHIVSLRIPSLRESAHMPCNKSCEAASRHVSAC